MDVRPKRFEQTNEDALSCIREAILWLLGSRARNDIRVVANADRTPFGPPLLYRIGHGVPGTRQCVVKPRMLRETNKGRVDLIKAGLRLAIRLIACACQALLPIGIDARDAGNAINRTLLVAIASDMIKVVYAVVAAPAAKMTLAVIIAAAVALAQLKIRAIPTVPWAYVLGRGLGERGWGWIGQPWWRR